MLEIDVAEVLFTLFWLFFIGLVFYLRREDKREGYPLESDRSDHITVQGFPGIPEPKTFALAHGGTQTAPRKHLAAGPIAAIPAAPHLGAPLVPTGNPMLDGIGPASWANRSDTPDLTVGGAPRVVPLRSAPGFSVDHRDADPRGMPVIAADGVAAGTVSDLWVDLAEPQILYLEIALPESAGGSHRVMPFGFANIDKRRNQIRVHAIHSHQFAQAPQLKEADRITLLEEDKVAAYFAGGLLYADASRQEPLL